jgi:hypothetical protein
VTGTFTELYMGTAPPSGTSASEGPDLPPRTIGLSVNYNF